MICWLCRVASALAAGRGRYFCILLDILVISSNPLVESSILHTNAVREVLYTISNSLYILVISSILLTNVVGEMAY